jgi:hypothetical protein
MGSRREFLAAGATLGAGFGTMRDASMRQRMADYFETH